MTHKIFGLTFFLVILGFTGCSSDQLTHNNRDQYRKHDHPKMMTQQDIITLTKAGVGDSLIISMIDKTDSWFRLKPQNVIDLKNAGVSEDVIAVMMEQPSNDSNNTRIERYYIYHPLWYGGFYPQWYNPRPFIRFGYHHRRFR